MLVDLIRSAIADRTTQTTGVVLSGGLDSSTVAALSAWHLPTFTGYYAEPDFDERSWARLVAHKEHHEILIKPEDFVEHFDAMVAALAPPYMGMGTFGQYMVAKYASQHVDRVMSGEGSDELFGGYARQMIVAGEDPPEGYENYKIPAGYPTTLEAALEYDWNLLPDLLAVDDQMCAAWGLESVAPFTDERIVAYAMALPASERVGKRHLRRAVKGIIPDSIIERKNKMGFPIPLIAWAQEEPVRSFALDRVGYLPDALKPWDRAWWYDMIQETTKKAVLV